MAIFEGAVKIAAPGFILLKDALFNLSRVDSIASTPFIHPGCREAWSITLKFGAETHAVVYDSKDERDRDMRVLSRLFALN